jgi:hypothetical protein
MSYSQGMVHLRTHHFQTAVVVQSEFDPYHYPHPHPHRHPHPINTMLRSLAMTFLFVHKLSLTFVCASKHTHTKSEVDPIGTKSGMGSLGGIRWASSSAKEVCILSPSLPLSLSLPTASKKNYVQTYHRNQRSFLQHSLVFVGSFLW